MNVFNRCFVSLSRLSSLRLAGAASFALLFAIVSVHAQTTPVTLQWATPAANATVSGTVQLSLSGQAFKNVEIFRNGQMLVRATVSSDLKRATAALDSKQFANGAVT